MDWEKIRKMRAFLKDHDRDEVDFSATDQGSHVPMPDIQKPWTGGELLVLPRIEEISKPEMTIAEAIGRRRSRRVYQGHEMKLEELSYLLWATAGIRANRPHRVLRTRPSAGNRHSDETYLAVLNVEGLKQGIYRYLPMEHALGLIAEHQDLYDRVSKATRMQIFASRSNVLFLWTSIPYRTEWRYDFASAKVIAIDMGHICQNLYLACESIGYGTCAIAAYDQDEADSLLEVDGTDEFTVYMAPVGFQDPGEQ